MSRRGGSGSGRGKEAVPVVAAAAVIVVDGVALLYFFGWVECPLVKARESGISTSITFSASSSSARLRFDPCAWGVESVAVVMLVDIVAVAQRGGMQ